MIRHDTRPFTTILDALFDDERVSIPLLFRLSDMEPAEMAEFSARWPRQEDERRQVISRHLADISEENFEVDFSPVFAVCLADPLPEVRLAALDGVWDSSNTALIRPIIQLMEQDEDVRVRALAASSLGHFILMSEWGQLPARVSEPIVAALLAQLDEPKTALPVRRAALESIGAATHPRVAGLIMGAYDSGDEPLQLSAVFAMGKSADTRWSDIVIDEMTSPSAAMRLEAARAAGGIGDEEAIAELADLIGDHELDVRLAAVTALGQIGGDLALKILTDVAEDPDAEELHEAVDEALEEIDWLGGDLDLSAFEWAGDEEG
jgi:HEAT repeat protein